MGQSESSIDPGDLTKITIIDYDEAHFTEKEARTVEECLPFKTTPTVSWLEIQGLGQPKIIEEIGKQFDLHPLILEDILQTDQRPKVENFGSHIVIVMNLMHKDQASHTLKTEQLTLVFGANFLISVQESESKVFDPIKDRLRNGVGRTRRTGPDYLAYSLIDAIVDNFYAILEKIGEEIDDLEEDLISNPESKKIQSALRLRKEISSISRSIWPLREVVNFLRKGDSPLIADSTDIYFGDVYDHIVKMIDTLQMFQDTLSQMYDVYRSTMLNRSNEIMKVLTIIATVFIPLTFIASIYGMNFKFIPELESPYGYPLVLITMAIVASAMLGYFRKKEWL